MSLHEQAGKKHFFFKLEGQGGVLTRDLRLCKQAALTTAPGHHPLSGGGPRVVVSTAAFHARVRGSVSGLGGLKETKMFLPHPRVKVSIVESLRDREVACSASDRQGSNFESCVWRTVSSHSSHHPQEVLLAQFSLYVHKGGLKPDSFHFLPPPVHMVNLIIIIMIIEHLNTSRCINKKIKDPLISWRNISYIINIFFTWMFKFIFVFAHLYVC